MSDDTSSDNATNFRELQEQAFREKQKRHSDLLDEKIRAAHVHVTGITGIPGKLRDAPQLRQRALEIAAQQAGDPETTVKRAEAYLAFLEGSTPKA